MKRKLTHLKQLRYPYIKISNERMEELNQILHNQQILYVYCDSSNIEGHPIGGIAACYVGFGITMIESRKVYTKYVNKSIYTELLAVKYSLQTLPKVINEYQKYSCDPKTINILSDISNIESMVYKFSCNKEYLSDVIREINLLLESSFYDLDIRLSFIGEQKKQNIFHKASHNAARRAIGKI